MKTKLIAGIGIGALTLSLGQSTVGAQERGIVTASALNVRSGPGLSYNTKGCLYKGDTVAVLDKENGWIKVQLLNSTTGWVSEKYVKIDNNTSVNIKVTCSARLNVRSGPGTSYSIKTSVKNGEVYKSIEKSKGWYKIELSNGTKGWVSGSYVKETTENVSTGSNENVTPDISETEVNSNGKATAGLNVRSGPGTNYSIKSSLKSGQVVFLLTKSSNGWYKIQLSNSTYGWVSSSYISKVNSDTNKDEEIDIDKNGKATASLNVRSGPSTSYSIKTVLRQGEVVTLTKSSNGWYEIKTSANITGWVSGKYITLTSDVPGGNTNSSNNTSADSKTEAVIDLAKKQLGKPYVWGGNGPNSFDCSGFTRYVYLHAAGVSLPRVSYDQAKSGTAVSRSNMKKGDLLHFATVTPGRTSHVGIYIGDNQFIHASGSQTNPDKVKINSLSGYYGNVLLGVRRIY